MAQGWWLTRHSMHSGTLPSPEDGRALDLLFWVGCGAWAAGAAVNMHSDHVLRSLRQPGGGGEQCCDPKVTRVAPHGSMNRRLKDVGLLGILGLPCVLSSVSRRTSPCTCHVLHHSYEACAAIPSDLPWSAQGTRSRGAAPSNGCRAPISRQRFWSGRAGRWRRGGCPLQPSLCSHSATLRHAHGIITSGIANGSKIIPPLAEQ